jgi:hypothetical protein
MELKKKLLSALNPNKATGPDNISGRFLKELHEELAPAPTLIFQAGNGVGSTVGTLVVSFSVKIDVSC